MSTSRALLAIALSVAVPGIGTAQQTLTFSNTDTSASPGPQPLVVNLLPGSTLAIAPTGNVSAECALTGSVCTGINVGGGSVSASLASSLTGSGPFAPGTAITLTPTVTGADVCVRSVGAGTPPTTWSGSSVTPVGAQTLTLGTAESTYSFRLTCYGTNASATSAPVTVTTGPGQPSSCPGFQVPLPSGWSRQSPPTIFSDVPVLSGGVWNDFPSGGGRGILGTPNSGYISIGFDTPTDVGVWNSTAGGKEFLWDPSQVAGAAIMAAVYVTISECAGDFRIPAAGTAATPDDPTFALGCRNVRPPNAGGQQQIFTKISYEISSAPSTDVICRLAPGRSYHLNFIRANVSDGVIGAPQGEAICATGGSNCGIDMDVR